MALMSSKGMAPSDPILIRAYKKEAEMEVWKRGRDGRYALLKTLPICRWSGQLGPKVRQGDRQAPEGFYAVTPAQMNPNSAYYLSFDTGFPNAYDRAQGATGAHLMVHGTCSSAGCYAMTDQGIAELYAIAREAFAGGQSAFQFQAYPFRMTAENMAKYRADPNMSFWQNLKEGSDRFEATREEPQVAVASGRYVFSVSPEGEALAARKMADDEQAYGGSRQHGPAAGPHGLRRWWPARILRGLWWPGPEPWRGQPSGGSRLRRAGRGRKRSNRPGPREAGARGGWRSADQGRCCTGQKGGCAWSKRAPPQA
jgi:murein L,D-transpeptidase YafK